MQVQQSFEVPFSRALVWRSFHDTEGIVTCLPGASLTAPPENGMLKLAMTVKLGPIVAAFAGDAEMKLDDSHCQGVVSGGGSDRKSGSRVKGEAAFALHEQAGATPSTRVDVTVDFTITGSLAQFSRGGIVQELAARMTEAFAANLRKKLEAESALASTAAATEEAGVAAPGADTTAGLAPAPGSDALMQPGAAPEAAATARANPAEATMPRPAQAPLDLGQLFWPMLLGRLRRLFGFGGKP